VQPALRGQIDRLLAAVEVEGGLDPEDLARLRAMAHARSDPADHSAGPDGGDGPVDPTR
jgi:hypothetical protein